jgi:hypothetical protein
MLKLILTGAALIVLSQPAFAETRSFPLVGGEDLPVEVISQHVANGPLIATRVVETASKTAEVANSTESGLTCGRRGMGACTATMDTATGN